VAKSGPNRRARARVPPSSWNSSTQNPSPSKRRKKRWWILWREFRGGRAFSYQLSGFRF